jgi:hypothetical protein
LEGDDKTDTEDDCSEIGHNPMDGVLRRPAIDEESNWAEDATDEHGWDSPFRNAIFLLIVDFEVCIKLKDMAVSFVSLRNTRICAHLVHEWMADL